MYGNCKVESGQSSFIPKNTKNFFVSLSIVTIQQDSNGIGMGEY
jgi:hypothetical protein